MQDGKTACLAFLLYFFPFLKEFRQLRRAFRMTADIWQ